MTLPTPSEQEVPKSFSAPTVVAGGQIQSLIPNSLDGVWRMAQMIANSPFAPKDMRTPEACSAAIMLGLDIGIPPLQAVQSIAVINGRPNVWGDLALAVCLAHPTCEAIDEEFEGDLSDFKTWKWICTATRKGRKPVRTVFTYDDAVRASLWNKEGPWRNYPKRMGQLRARAFSLRDAFPDVLRGLAIREEVEDIDHGKQPAPKPGAQDPNIVDAEVREIQQDQAKPAETVAPKEEAKPKPDPKPKADKKADAEKPAETKKSEAEKPKDEPKPDETKGEQDAGSDFPGDANYKPPQDKAGSAQQDQGEPYNGVALLAELEEIIDECDSIERLDMSVTKGAKGKATRGFTIIEQLTRSDKEAAQHMYTNAKARIQKQMDEDAAKEGAAAGDAGEGEQQDHQQASTGAAKDPASMTAEEYDQHWRDIIDTATDPVPLKTPWFSEADIRRALESDGGWSSKGLNDYRKKKIDVLTGNA